MKGPHPPQSATAGVRGVDLEWEWYIPLSAMACGVMSAVAALAQRDAFSPPTYELAVGAVAVSPWLIEHATRWAPPRLLFGLVPVAAVAVLLSAGNAPEFDFAPFILVIMASELGATGNHWEAAAVLTAVIGSLAAVDLTGNFDGTPIWGAGTVAGWGFGHAMQVQLRLQAEERARQHDLVDKATVGERQRIAREVHDVIAHSLSVTMLHLTGARHALESGADPAEAADALRDAERLGRQAMNDIRRTVGLLAPDAAGITEPMPGVADIPALVDDFSSAGLAAACEIGGDLASVSLATGLGLYRITQESLANVAKHAPAAPVTVRVDVVGGDVRLVVRNAAGNGAAPLHGAPDVGGLGLRGMEERARLLGGTFRAGPHDGGWVVEVTAPLEAAGT